MSERINQAAEAYAKTCNYSDANESYSPGEVEYECTIAFENGAQWQAEQLQKAVAFCQRIAKMEKGCAPSAGYMQELIEAAEKALK